MPSADATLDASATPPSTTATSRPPRPTMTSQAGAIGDAGSGASSGSGSHQDADQRKRQRQFLPEVARTHDGQDQHPTGQGQGKVDRVGCAPTSRPPEGGRSSQRSKPAIERPASATSTSSSTTVTASCRRTTKSGLSRLDERDAGQRNRDRHRQHRPASSAARDPRRDDDPDRCAREAEEQAAEEHQRDGSDSVISPIRFPFSVNCPADCRVPGAPPRA